MKRLSNKLKSITGVSFLEIMIALGITSFVTAAIFRLYVVQHQNYLVQDDITEVQQNARASIDQLARTIRMAGYATPVGLAPLQAYNTNSDTIVLAYREDGCQVSVTTKMPNVTSPIVCGSSVSCFTPGQWVYIYHPDSGGSEWFQISSVDAGTNSIFHVSNPLSKAYPPAAIVTTMKEVKFYIDTTTTIGKPSLMIKNRGAAPIIFADDIVDLQFRYKMKNGMTLDQPPIIADVREVIISLTGRSKNPNVEDVSNPYKFRTFNTTVGLRNLDL